jgi:ABC-type transporter Mla maintaining outer membrane lipid asymmetry permease subunit MlaE
LLLATSVLGAIGPQDVLAVLGNSVVPGLYTAASCCVGGLDVGMSLAEVPRATQRALVHSVIGLFGISTIVTVLTYIG